MVQLRRSAERGHLNHGWLDTYHTFSFGEYYDPQQMGFRSLRVMNEDRVAPGKGFGMHGHRDMEIVTYVLEGALEHKDSMGNGEVLRPGEFQRMSAGTGIRHSEFNPSESEPVHLYQVWLLPREQGIEPSYEQKRFGDEQLVNRFRVVASPDAVDGSLSIQQDASIYLARLEASGEAVHDLAPGRHAWLQVLRGDAELNAARLVAGDGAAISDELQLRVTTETCAELLLFDMA